ncbi:Methenyltetrahydrofolate cyclohydrolase / Methylenetetrahydrofolate dehydrogenase (NADP+) [[Mycoplasma] cavipharyngis]|uniref:bifunctional 5,10-methylenetetrahydrofolate dehydrogenase/5,10-methenyltetrahydrofolate cyclohydrolase n=1 Tax=[Mycoplasma] cavipharyngis TaxID=92757 RepID=UPI003703BCFE
MDHKINTIVLNGRVAADAWIEDIKNKILALKRQPRLGIIQIGDNLASSTYIKNKLNIAKKVNVIAEHLKFNANYSQDQLINLINDLQNNDLYDGILIQLPLPEQINEIKVLQTLKTTYDVDGLSVATTAKIWNTKKFNPLEEVVPCTPKGIIKLLNHYQIDCQGKKIVIINRSNIVGKPLAAMLLALDATVSICHSRTKNLIEYTSTADIIITGVGKTNFLTPNLVAKHAVVIDVSINFDHQKKLVGDVPRNSLLNHCQAYSPVPNGVGPMTVAAIFDNLYLLTKKKITQ